MKRLLSCLGIASFFISIAAAHASFVDVSSDSWFKSYTDYLVTQGIVSNNAQFYPFRTITRAELAKMAANAGVSSHLFSLENTNHQYFCDVPNNHWAASFIDTLAAKNIINGSTSSSCTLEKQFFPDRPITRAEAVKILLNLYQIAPEGNQNFHDVDSNIWYSSYIAAAVHAGLVNGYADGSFQPNNFLTRAEMSKILVKAIQFHQNHFTNPNQTISSDNNDNPSSSTPSAAPTPSTNTNSAVSVHTGALTIYSLGDSLTAGDGDDSGQNGYPNRLLADINSIRPGSTIHNIGVSGVDSSTLVQDQLPQALQAHPDLVTVLIGSNDMWQDGWNDTDTSTATIQNYRDNIETILSQLHQAGIKVYIGLVDDQSLRPAAQGSGMSLNDTQRARMSRIATAFNQIIQQKAAQYGATTVDFYHTTIFTSSSTLADDGNHPNANGYDAMTGLWFNAIRSSL